MTYVLSVSRILICTTVIASSLSGLTDAVALESTAAGRVIEANSGISNRLDALNAAMTTSLNTLTAEVSASKACGALRMFYAPGAPGATAGGCLALIPDTPAKTIAAFNLASCPTGWSAYSAANGRFLVGYGTAGGRSYATIGSTADSVGKQGEAFHTLTIAEMPTHHHDYSLARRAITDVENDTEINMVQDLSYQTRATSDTGGGQPHENRPPFLVVLWCIKN
jgi:hypothetical protein